MQVFQPEKREHSKNFYILTMSMLRKSSIGTPTYPFKQTQYTESGHLPYRHKFLLIIYPPLLVYYIIDCPLRKLIDIKT